MSQSSPSNNLKEAEELLRMFAPIADEYDARKPFYALSEENVPRFTAAYRNLILDTILASKEMQPTPDPLSLHIDDIMAGAQNQKLAQIRVMLEGMKNG